jgi:hypothetical protein
MPHYSMGMVGLIVVGDAPAANLVAAKALRPRRRPRSAWIRCSRRSPPPADGVVRLWRRLPDPDFVLAVSRLRNTPRLPAAADRLVCASECDDERLES